MFCVSDGKMFCVIGDNSFKMCCLSEHDLKTRLFKSTLDNIVLLTGVNPYLFLTCLQAYQSDIVFLPSNTLLNCHSMYEKKLPFSEVIMFLWYFFSGDDSREPGLFKYFNDRFTFNMDVSTQLQ